MKLNEAFNIVRGEVVAFIGAGGKTSALVGLGYELRESGWRVLATATHHVSREQLQFFPAALSVDAPSAAISDALSEHGFVFLYQSVRGDTVTKAPVSRITRLLDIVDSDVLLVEADGADGLPLKVPYDHEPTIPVEASLVIPVASLAALDKPLDETNIYNPRPIVEKFGFFPGSKMRAPWIAQVLRDDELGLRGIPEGARVVAFLNQTPQDGYDRTRARMIARLALRSPRLNGVVLGSVRAADPVCEVQRAVGAVVLAGGRSSRMGTPKVLLPWSDGKTIIEHIVEQLIRSRLDHIVVVTGYYADEVKKRVKPLGVKVTHNRAHATGEMLSSLKAGLRALPDHTAAALVTLGDQPRLEPRVIYDVLTAYAEGCGEIIAPSYKMRRGHPLLIGRRYWPEFLALKGYQTPRDVFDAHADEIHYINVNTDSILRDVDTPADYLNERQRAGLDNTDIDFPPQ